MAFLGKRILVFSNRNLITFGRFFSTSRCRFQEEKNLVVEDTKGEIEEYSPKEYALLLQKNRTIKRVDREPFATNLFIGNVDTDLLSFPEVLEREEVDNLGKYTSRIKKLMQDAKGQSILTRKDLLAELQEMGLYGLTIPQEYGGLGATMTEFASLAEELGQDSSLMAVLNPHLMLAAQQLLMSGTQEQKELFLPKMASGEQIATFCFREPNIGSDLNQTKTLACHSLDGYSYLLEGEKYWVPNGTAANLFFTLAKSKSQSESQDSTVLSTYLVPRDSTVHTAVMVDVSGLKESHYSTLTLSKTTIPEINQLGRIGSGFGETHQLFAYNRFGIAASVLGKLKGLRRLCVDHMVNTKRFGKYLSKYDSLLTLLGEMHQDIYLLESTLYFTAAIMDTSPADSHHVENALLMALCRELTFKTISVARNIFGVDALRDSHPCQKYTRDLQTLFYTETSDHILKVYAALIGSAHVGNLHTEMIKRIRNPFKNPMTYFKFIISQNKKMKSGHTSLDLAGYVHPSLMSIASELDRLVVSFEATIISVLDTYGRNVLDHQMDLIRIGDVAMYLYAMLACVSRCSRSYCIGLHNADHEMSTTCILANSHLKQLKNLMKVVLEGDTLALDSMKMKHGAKLIEIKDQFHEKAFQYND